MPDPSRLTSRVLMDLRIPRIGHLRFWRCAREENPRGAHVDHAESSKGVFDTSVGGEPTLEKCGRRNVHLDKPQRASLIVSVLLARTKIRNDDGEREITVLIWNR